MQVSDGPVSYLPSRLHLPKMSSFSSIASYSYLTDEQLSQVEGVFPEFISIVHGGNFGEQACSYWCNRVSFELRREYVQGDGAIEISIMRAFVDDFGEFFLRVKDRYSAIAQGHAGNPFVIN